MLIKKEQRRNNHFPQFSLVFYIFQVSDARYSALTFYKFQFILDNYFDRAGFSLLIIFSSVFSVVLCQFFSLERRVLGLEQSIPDTGGTPPPGLLNSTPAEKIPPPQSHKEKEKGEKFTNSLRDPRKLQKKRSKINFPLRFSNVNLKNFLKEFIS